MSSKSKNSTSARSTSTRRKRKLLYDDDSDDGTNFAAIDPTTTSTTVVSPVKATHTNTDTVARTPRSKRQRNARSTGYIDSFLSPRKKKKTVANVVTPQFDHKDTTTKSRPAQEKEEGTRYVPKYLYKNVGYTVRNQAKLSPEVAAAFAWICDHFIIPDDIEGNRSYGPLSGTCYENRVLQAYNLGQLAAKQNATASTTTMICTTCAEVGHKWDECPRMI